MLRHETAWIVLTTLWIATVSMLVRLQDLSALLLDTNNLLIGEEAKLARNCTRLVKSSFIAKFLSQFHVNRTWQNYCLMWTVSVNWTSQKYCLMWTERHKTTVSSELFLWTERHKTTVSSHLICFCELNVTKLLSHVNCFMWTVSCEPNVIKRLWRSVHASLSPRHAIFLDLFKWQGNKQNFSTQFSKILIRGPCVLPCCRFSAGQSLERLNPFVLNRSGTIALRFAGRVSSFRASDGKAFILSWCIDLFFACLLTQCHLHSFALLSD